GTQEERGKQAAALTASQCVRLMNFPKDFLKEFGAEKLFPELLKIGKRMSENFPPDIQKELAAFAEEGQIDRDLLLAGNTFPDIKKAAGCSTLTVDPARSKTGGPLFGRNLDFPTLGYLWEYSLVTIYRPKGKHAFVSIGFPGMLGCLSGMNDAGLSLAVLEVYS